jgi:hypothetical protein
LLLLLLRNLKALHRDRLTTRAVLIRDTFLRQLILLVAVLERSPPGCGEAWHVAIELAIAAAPVAIDEVLAHRGASVCRLARGGVVFRSGDDPRRQ